ncbi:MAG: MFS transporter [Clostridia bacterium]|nr:MFS transporter [Clostridia bacterium]
MSKRLGAPLRLVLATLPLYLSSGVGAPATPAFLMSIGAGTDVQGLSSSIGLMLVILFAPFFGRLGKAYSNRRVIVLSFILSGSASLLPAAAPAVWSFILARSVANMLGNCSMVCVMAYLLGCTGDGERARYMVATSVVSSALPALGYLLGGFLADISPRLAYAAQGLLHLLAAALMLLAVRQDQPQSDSIGSVRRILREENPISAFLRCRAAAPVGLMLLFAVTVSSLMGQSAFDQSFNFYLQDQLGLTPGMGGVVRCLTGALAMLVNFTLGMRLAGGKRRMAAIITAALLCAVSCAGAVLSGRVGFIISGGLFYAAIAVFTALTSSVFGDMAARGDHGLMNAVNSSVGCLGGALSGLVSGYIYRADPAYPFALGAAVCLVSAALAARLKRRTNNYQGGSEI